MSCELTLANGMIESDTGARAHAIGVLGVAPHRLAPSH